MDKTPDKNNDEALAKAAAFFAKAKEIAAETDNFDYAIDMYLQGLRFSPDALQKGHIPLCELALHRQGKGGKKPTMMEKMKHLRGKTPLEQLINAESLFAKDPEHTPYAEAMLKAAVDGGYNKTADWIANLIFQKNNALDKPSLQTYILLKDSYKALGKIDKAVAACQWALKLKPNDENLTEDFKNLSVDLTMARGKYDKDGNFRESIKDREEQEHLLSQRSVIQTEDYRLAAVERARKELALNPNEPRSIFNMAYALSALRTEEADNEAIELLENAYKNRDDFSLKQRAGQIRIKQLQRKIRQAKTELESNPDQQQTRSRLDELSAKLKTFELEHFRQCVVNYPTDLQAKYEYGTRLLENKQYNEAIPFLQEAQKEPRYKIAAMNKTGLCFFSKGWIQDAIDIFNRAIESYELKDDRAGKELRYNLARAYEEQGNAEKALDIYRKIAQIDFTYKDVGQRVDKLRQNKADSASEQGN